MNQITKRALSQSLKKLLANKPLDKITVTDIVEDCGVNRQTFYYHFQDMADLVEWTCLEDADKALQDRKTYSTWQEGFLSIFNLMKEDQTFIMVKLAGILNILLYLKKDDILFLQYPMKKFYSIA